MSKTNLIPVLRLTAFQDGFLFHICNLRIILCDGSSSCYISVLCDFWVWTAAHAWIMSPHHWEWLLLEVSRPPNSPSNLKDEASTISPNIGQTTPQNCDIISEKNDGLVLLHFLWST